MNVDTRFEGLYSQIVLVRGAGDRRKGQLCLMSLAAFLAGESHSDNPATSSAVIRRFAMTINDEMPAELRQQLKPFAPLIIGTCDGRDNERAILLTAVMRADMLPRIKTDFCDTLLPTPCPKRKSKTRTWPETYHQMIAILSGVGTPLDVRECDQIAAAVARVICHCGRMAPLPEQRAWYWAQAVDLLDRLCMIGNKEPRPEVPDSHLSAMHTYMQQRYGCATPADGRWTFADTWTRARRLLPALVR